MKKTIKVFSMLLITALWGSQAWAWASANRFGGSTSHMAGEGTEHTNAWGGSSAHAWGGGTAHTNMYGGTTAGRYGEGAYHQGPGGVTAYHPPGYPAYPGYRPPIYHPPVAVPYYSAGGCYGCAAAAGAVVGMAVGASVASANTAVATSNAYAAGVAAGAASAPVFATGVNYVSLPQKSAPVTIRGTTYYLLGNTWFKPLFGANGVYYHVVPTP